MLEKAQYHWLLVVTKQPFHTYERYVVKCDEMHRNILNTLL
jgi:hypothetical protein